MKLYQKILNKILFKNLNDNWINKVIGIIFKKRFESYKLYVETWLNNVIKLCKL